MTNTQLQRKRANPQVIRDNAVGYAFILPFIALYILFSLYPLAHGFIISFNKWNIVQPMEFVGLKNYAKLLQDKKFWEALGHTFEFLIYSTIPLMAGGFFMAVMVNSRYLRGQALFRAVFFSPQVLTVSIISYMWQSLLDPYNGLINGVLKSLGLLDPSPKVQIFWLSNPDIVWWSITLITVWWTVGYNMIIYLAAMQDIPESLYESAALDGANDRQLMWHITFPSLKRIHATLLFLQIIASFKVFGQIFLVTSGGPMGRTRAFIQYIYETAFQRFNMGEGSAASFMLFIIILIVSFIQLRVMDKAND